MSENRDEKMATELTRKSGIIHETKKNRDNNDEKIRPRKPAKIRDKKDYYT